MVAKLRRRNFEGRTGTTGVRRDVHVGTPSKSETRTDPNLLGTPGGGSSLSGKGFG